MKRILYFMIVLLACLGSPPGAFAQTPPLEIERDPDFLAGQAALADGFYGVAAMRFEDFVNKTVAKRRKAYGAVFLLRAWYGDGQYDRMIEWMRQNWSISHGTRDEPSFYFWYAQAKYATKQYDDTLEYLKKLESRFPKDDLQPYVLRLRALALRDSGKLESAETHFARFDKQYKDHVEVPDNLLDWAGVLIRLNKTDLGTDTLVRLVNQHPETDVAKRARLWLGQWSAENNNIDVAIEWLQPLAKSENVDQSIRSEAWFSIATIQVNQGNISNALYALTQGEITTTNLDRRVEARIDQARLLMTENRLVEAIQIMDATVVSLAMKPQAARAQLELSDLLRAQGLHEKALEAYQRYLESFSDEEGQLHALMGRAWCLWELKRYPEAALAFEKALSVLTNDSLREQASVKIADAYFMNGQYRLAAAAYEKSADNFPSSEMRPQRYYQAAEAYVRMNDMTNAYRIFTMLAAEYSDMEVAKQGLLRLAEIQLEQADLTGAGETYGRIISYYPDDPVHMKAMVGLGLLYYRQGLYAEAIQNFTQVIKSFPDQLVTEKAHIYLAWSQYLSGEVEAALNTAQQFLVAYTNSAWIPDVAFWLTEHEFNQQYYGLAETNFAQLASSYPANRLAERALFWAGRSASEQKAHRRAIDYYNALIRNYTNSVLIPDARFAQGDALTEMGDFSGAILAFEEIIKKYPDHILVPRALGRIGDCQFTLGTDRPERYQEAAVTFRSALNHPLITADVAIQAEYKLARTYERMGRLEEASAHYLNVMYGWLAAREASIPLDEVWLVRSAFSAAAIKEGESAWSEAEKIYKRIVDSDLTAAVDAGIRLERLATQRQKNGAGKKMEAGVNP
ncbi:MAG TPA: tetratricopeptide repeat protein [Kiritimatiellia bacterium]|nr:tetratricopeptide repeat protein [Kiritimatiellia bacterium]